MSLLNVRKCVTYLRRIGCEIDAATERQWLDAQESHRFLGRMKSAVAHGWDWWCANGHHRYRELGGRRNGIARNDEKCECGARWAYGHARWTELADGTVRDRRPPEDRWKPLNDPSAP